MDLSSILWVPSVPYNGIMNTAITPATMARYRATFRAREAARAASVAERLRTARAAASAAATVLKRDFGATRVLLFGSAARGQGFHDRSDIDLAVEGVQIDQFWTAERSAGFDNVSLKTGSTTRCEEGSSRTAESLAWTESLKPS